tara:strand:- start:6788 stop:8449 length:1662 start_codon:yes stop_codon:yes gene_type:complete
MTTNTARKRKKRNTSNAGADFATAPGIHDGKVKALFSTPDAFVSMCHIVREDESTGFMEPTHTQKKLLKAYDENRWLMVNKFRQAKITTVSVMLLLRDCMYLSGVKGLLIAERQDTAEDIFERILFAYNRLPADVKMPLAPGRKAGATQMQFIHGGGIKVLTAGGRSPAIGRSIDRLVITEFGEAQWQRKAAINIFPTVNKRPNAKVILESTPGRAGSHHEQMWRSALEGTSRFHPLFLEWWEDESCQEKDESFEPSASELEYLDRHDGMSKFNLAFRRRGLNTEFVGDTRLFSCKYPSDEYDGWLGSTNPVMPAEILKPLLDQAEKDPILGPYACHEFEPPKPGHKYVITADPAGFGSTGDKSALTVWDAHEWREIAFWEDRETPDRFAQRLRIVQKRYLGALLAVESNATACIAILKDQDTRNLLWTDRNHPGWYATQKRIQESEARLVRMLREKELNIRSRGMLHQLLNYDGTRKKRVRGEDGTVHHFDRARTAVMAADILARRHFTQETSAVESDYIPGQITIKQLDRVKSKKLQSVKTVFKPASQIWK